MISFFFGVAAAGRRRRVGERRSLRKQFLGGKAQPVDDRENLRPLLVQESFAFAGKQ